MSSSNTVTSFRNPSTLDKYNLLECEVEIKLEGFINNKYVMKEILDIQSVLIKKHNVSSSNKEYQIIHSSKSIQKALTNTSSISIKSETDLREGGDFYISYLGYITPENAEKRMKRDNSVKIYHKLISFEKNTDNFDKIPLTIIHRISRNNIKHFEIFGKKNHQTKKYEYSLNDKICQKIFDNCIDLLNEYVKLYVNCKSKYGKCVVRGINFDKKDNFFGSFYIGVKSEEEAEKILNKYHGNFLIYHRVPNKFCMMKTLHECVQLYLVSKFSKYISVHMPIKKTKNCGINLYYIPLINNLSETPKFENINDLISYFSINEKTLRKCCKLFLRKHLNA
uniref:SH2 domain-containing protein n=1 Tax=Parastrongyloides trichosuri TaxID=131310 RepID=A0A0N4ZUR3_PARTI